MQDQIFMKGWDEAHTRLSADLDRGIRHLHNRFSRTQPRREAIGNPYGLPVEVDAGPSLSPAARASLRGLAASVTTVALWVLVLMLATPAPGLAAAPDASTTMCQCMARPPLA